jgi:hypothetical protein
MVAHRFIFALPVALLAASGAASAQTHAEIHKLRCAVATDYAALEIARAGNGRMLFANGRPNLFDAVSIAGDGDGDGWWIEAADPPARADVPAALVARIGSEGNLSAGPVCATFRALLRSHRILYGTQAIGAAMRARRHGHDSRCILMISLPVLSQDGRLAVLARSNSCAGSSLELVERSADGRLRVVASKPLGVY